MSTSKQTINETDKTAAERLINKSIEGTGLSTEFAIEQKTMTLSENNSEFNQKSFIIGDGIDNSPAGSH